MDKSFKAKFASAVSGMFTRKEIAHTVLPVMTMYERKIGDYQRGKEAGWKEALGIFEKLYGIDMGQGTKGAIDGISQQNNRRNHAVCRAGQEVQQEAVGSQQAQTGQDLREKACMHQREGGSMPEMQKDGTGQVEKGEPEEVSSLVLGYLRRRAGPDMPTQGVVHPKIWDLSIKMSEAGWKLAKEIQECQFSEGQAQSLMLLDMLHSFDEQVARKAAKAFLQETSEPVEEEKGD